MNSISFLTNTHKACCKKTTDLLILNLKQKKTKSNLCSPSNKNRNQTYVRNQCRGEPCVRPPNNNRLRTYVRGNSFSNIGLVSVCDRRANIRFAPTLVLLIGLRLIFVRDEHKVRQIPKEWTTIYDRPTLVFPGIFIALVPTLCVGTHIGRSASSAL